MLQKFHTKQEIL